MTLYVGFLPGLWIRVEIDRIRVDPREEKKSVRIRPKTAPIFLSQLVMKNGKLDIEILNFFILVYTNFKKSFFFIFQSDSEPGSIYFINQMKIQPEHPDPHPQPPPPPHGLWFKPTSQH